MMDRMTFIALRYDMRTTPTGRTTRRSTKRPWIRSAGPISSGWTVVLSEHHVSEEGYLPSPLVMAGAVAGATDRITIMLAALLPWPAAPDPPGWRTLAVLDHLASGRVLAVLGIGLSPDRV